MNPSVRIPAFCPWPALGSPLDLLRRFGRPRLRRLWLYREPPALPVTSRFSVEMRFGSTPAREPAPPSTALRVKLPPFHHVAVVTDDGASAGWWGSL